MRARLALAQGDLDAALRWADTCGLRASDEPSFPREMEHLTLVRVLIAQGRGDPGAPFLLQAGTLLDRLLAAAEAGARMGSRIEIAILRALALAAQGDTDAALAATTYALRLAAPEGYVRLFVDEGAPMAALLRAELGGLRSERLLREYIERLLNAFDQPREQVPQPSVLSPQFSSLVEPLSAREIEILRLIANGLSNQAIADTLVIAISTVKRHINNIYGKLAVQSRTQALVRARDLGLL
jgi:LuxR family maltose regulon positive regulatory protein